MKLVDVGTRHGIPVWVAPEKVLSLTSGMDPKTTLIGLQTGASSTVSVLVDDCTNAVAWRLNAELKEPEQA